MKETILRAEINVDMAKIIKNKSIEINLLLTDPGAARKYNQIQRPVNSYPGHPSSASERKGYTRENAVDENYSRPNRANVRVSSVTVNVNTRNANY